MSEINWKLFVTIPGDPLRVLEYQTFSGAYGYLQQLKKRCIPGLDAHINPATGGAATEQQQWVRVDGVQEWWDGERIDEIRYALNNPVPVSSPFESDVQHIQRTHAEFYGIVRRFLALNQEGHINDELYQLATKTGNMLGELGRIGRIHLDVKGGDA